MKKVHICLLYFIMYLFFGSTNILALGDLYLKIELINKEHSKDSNSQRYIVEVKNKNITYDYKYEGFPFIKDNHMTSKRILSDIENIEIIKFINNKGIDKPIIEIKSTKANGPSREVNLLLLLKLEGKSIKTKIFGTTKIFRADGNIEGKIIENKKYLKNIESLIVILKGRHYFFPI